MKKDYTGKPMRLVHTGVTQFAPENTLEAFKKAVELGCEGVELDIQLCGDGEIIVTHNNSLGYMTFERNRAFLKDLTANEIKQVDIPYRNALKLKYPPYPWTEHDGGRRMITPPDYREDRVTRLITFKEFDGWLSTVKGDFTVEVEFKTTGMCRRMDEILSASSNVSRYIFFSGDWDVLEEMQAHYRQNGKPEGLRLGANIRFINEKTMDFVRRSDLWEVGLNNEAFTKEDVDMFDGMGIKVFSNLGDYPEWWKKICEMGIEGFKTNYPDAFTEWWIENQK
ncbi:MAG: glycerophosphodiester phosphodiesterase [Ruminococcaceae bacterium]|nr:glycerophosphodiester phosphodiesterase [Oscillospiraceae bacterium]